MGWNRMIPDVWCVSRDVVLCPGVKVVLCAFGGWADALVFCPVLENRERFTAHEHNEDTSCGKFSGQ